MHIWAKYKASGNSGNPGPEPYLAYFVPKIVGGSARESNPPTPLVTRHNGFEERYPTKNEPLAIPHFLIGVRGKDSYIMTAAMMYDLPVLS